MHYFDWIQAKRTGQLTAAEGQAYQHEQAENTALRVEEDAVELMEALLSAGAAGMVDPTPAPQPDAGRQAAGYRRSTWVAGSVMAAFLLLLGWWATQRTTTTPTVDEPATVPAKEWGPRFQESLPVVPVEQGTPAEVEETTKPVETPAPPPVAQRKSATPQEQMSTAGPQVAEATPRQEKTIPAEQEMVLEGMQVDKGGVLAVSSKKTIILKAGFHAKAGARFTAKVEADEASPR